VIAHLATLRRALGRLFSREPVAQPDANPFSPADDLRFECGRFPAGWIVRYRVKKGWISRAFRDSWDVRERHAVRKRHPTPEDWMNFWRTMAPLRIWDWKPSYFAPPGSLLFVIDGGSWRFSCRRGKQRMKSFGGNYYPKLWRPQETDSRHDAMVLLRAGLDALLSPSLGIGVEEPLEAEHESSPEPNSFRSGPDGAE